MGTKSDFKQIGVGMKVERIRVGKIVHILIWDKTGSYVVEHHKLTKGSQPLRLGNGGVKWEIKS